MNLHVLAYNFKRLMAILGIANMMAAIRAYARFLRRSGLFWAVGILDRLKSMKMSYGPARRFLVLHS